MVIKRWTRFKLSQSDSRSSMPGHPLPQSKKDFRWFSDNSKTRLQMKKLSKVKTRAKREQEKTMQLWSYMCAKGGTQIGLRVF